MGKQQLQELDQTQREDHETLIRLEGKVDSLVEKVQIMSDGMNERVIDHESRLKTIERLVQSTHPEEAVKRIDQMWDERRDRNSERKFVFTIVSLISTFIGFMLSLLLKVWEITRK